MKRYLLPLALAALLLFGCDEKGSLKVLFTSDVKGRLTPAG